MFTRGSDQFGTDISSSPTLEQKCQLFKVSYFREAFKLFEFDIQELEESLLLLGTEDDCDHLVFQLVISLLQGCLPSFKKRINKEVCAHE